MSTQHTGQLATSLPLLQTWVAPPFLAGTLSQASSSSGASQSVFPGPEVQHHLGTVRNADPHPKTIESAPLGGA